MGVVIDQLEQVAPAAEPSARGVESGGSGDRSATAGAVEAQLIQLLRREASRQARLWAD